MFIIIPLIIIFFCVAYLQLSDDVGVISYSVVAFIITTTLYISFKIYKSVKEDLKVQELNGIKIQINELIQKINKEKDQQKKKNLELKLEDLEEYLNKKEN
jgi:amino acid permease